MPQRDAVDDFLDGLVGDSFDEVAQAVGHLDPNEIYINNQPPVDIIQFVEDPHYIGGLVACDPQILQLLYLIEEKGVLEAFVQVGKGSGKSLIGSITPTYGAYTTLCMRRPHTVFGISQASIISSINVSIGRKQAKDVIFAQVKDLVENGPWFKANAAFETLTEEIRFQERRISLFCGHSNSTAFLGYATLRAVMDEVNFMFDNANRNVAERLYAALSGSCKTRFPNDYKLVCVSSSSTPAAWLNKEVQHIERHGKEVTLRPGGLPKGLRTPVEKQDDDLLDIVLD